MNKGKHGNLTTPKHSFLRMSWGYKDGGWLKRAFWKGERQAQKAALPERLDDDYTLEEWYGDICTEDEPCPWCKAAK